MTDSTRLCTTCFRFVAIFALFAAALSVASTAFAQVLDEEDGLQRLPGPIGAKAGLVTGRVLDAQSEPIGNAHVLFVGLKYARSARPIGVHAPRSGLHTLPLLFEVVGPVDTDDKGKFELHVPASRSSVYAGLDIYAAARGHGCTTRLLGQTASREPIELVLGAEHVIRGRLIDLKGQPAASVTVQVVKRGWRPPCHTLEIWEPVTSDDKGRFLIRGLDQESCHLQIEGEQFTPQRSYVKPVPIGSEDQTTLSLAPAKRIQGTVTFGDTGKPAANVRIISPHGPGGGFGDWIESRADANGDYSISPFALRDNPYREGYKLNVFPPTGERYLVAEITVPPSRAAIQQVDITLDRGVLIRGRVSETVSERPVAGARIQHIALRSFADESTGLQTAITADDGTFELPVPATPGGDPRIPVADKPGHLLVLGPTLDFIRVESSQQELDFGRKPGKHRRYADAVVRLDFEPGTTESAVDIKLRKGVRLNGRVLDPDGKPASEFVLFSRSYLAHGYQPSRFGSGTVLECRDGEFELPGCDPDQTHTVHFFDRNNGWGATAELSRKHESDPAIVHLEPCGSADARFVDANGKPLAKFQPEFGCAVSDGSPRYTYAGIQHEYALDADVFTSFAIDHKRPFTIPVTNDDGRIVFPTLIPGARYVIYWGPNDLTDPAPWPHVAFTVRAGEKKDLGDIVITGRRVPQ